MGSGSTAGIRPAVGATRSPQDEKLAVGSTPPRVRSCRTRSGCAWVDDASAVPIWPARVVPGRLLPPPEPRTRFPLEKAEDAVL